MTTTFEYGSLADARHEQVGAPEPEPTEDDLAVLGELESLVDGFADDVVAAEVERRRAEEKARRRRQRRPPPKRPKK